MTSQTILLLCLLSLMAVQPAAAQTGGGPLRERLQDRVQSEIDRKAAQTRTQIEQQLAARQSPAEIAQVRQVQTALTFFTFDAGPIDGIMGQQTRTAIEEYQAYLDYPVTGQLTESEAQFLLVAYQQAQANSAQAQQIADAHPDGIKGFLLVVRYGAPQRPTGVIPSFSIKDDPRDAAALCAEPAASSAADPSTEQTVRTLFCSARGAAIAQSELLVANAAGFTQTQIEEQCVAFEPALASVVESVSNGSAFDVVQGAAEFVQRTGQDPLQMSGIARVCLGVGYRRNQYNLAIGSAVLLTALEKLTYAEYAGYHVALGLGAAQDPARARSWFELAMQSEPNTPSEFESGATDRRETLRGAVMYGGSEGSPSAAPIPSFSVSE